MFPRPLEVASDGSARIDRPLPEAAAGARSLAYMADWLGHGTHGIAACGDIDVLKFANGHDEAPGELTVTRESTTRGDGLLLGNVLTAASGGAQGALVLTGLVPHAAYEVDLSLDPCGPKDLHPDIPLLQIVADDRGTAHASFTHAFMAERQPSSLAVSRSIRPPGTPWSRARTRTRWRSHRPAEAARRARTPGPVERHGVRPPRVVRPARRARARRSREPGLPRPGRRVGESVLRLGDGKYGTVTLRRL